MKPFSAPYTVLTDRLRGRGHKSAWIEYIITATCAIGNMLFGYDQGVMGGFLTSIPFEQTFPSISSNGGNTTLQGFTVAVYEIGCAIGALTVIFYGDRYGRRVTVMMGQTILIVGSVLQFTSYSLAQLIVGRIVSKFEKIMTTTSSDIVANKKMQRALVMEWLSLFSRPGTASALDHPIEDVQSYGN